ncbi:hypothetical protein DM141_20370 [Shigella sonnei]|jgi:hypothetical protein|nr:hypothetical protein [Shigella boydii]EGE1027883.1 hypothetical protein [Shigella sonnei]
MITAQEARTNSETLDTSEYLVDLDKWITKASLEGRDHIKLFKKPYSEIGSPNARPVMRKVTEQLVSFGYKIKYNPPLSQMDTESVQILW